MVLRFLGLSGSLRTGSFNRMLLAAARDAMPEGATLDVFDGLGELPYYNADVDHDPLPPLVVRLRQLVANADALVIATPEYNYSVPGVLKNAIDWASRPATSSSLIGKPILLMGASTGMVGTARAQASLRISFTFTRSHVLPGPEILVSYAQEKFDAGGHLTDETTRNFVVAGLQRLIEFTRTLQR